MHYGVNIEGLVKPWLEISSYAIQELTHEELEFMIARELVHLQNQYNLYEILL